MRASRWSGAGWLTVPLVMAILLGYALPILLLLSRGVRDEAAGAALPRTVAALRHWDGLGLPADDAYAGLAADLAKAAGTAALSEAASRLNLDQSGLRSVLLATARKLAPGAADPRAAVLAADPAWHDVESWGAIRRASGPLSDFQLLAALDLKRDATGAIHQAPEDERVFRGVILRSFAIAGMVTLATLLLGYPTAALIATRARRLAGPLLLCVLVPFWTSLLVRTAAWMVLLSRQGVVNASLLSLGVIGAPLEMLYHRVAVVIAMAHILLPYMILPLVAVMREVPRPTMLAAASLGASPATVFRRVWLPQTMPGVAAGVLMVFVQALGFYVTPALIGGASDQMLPWFIGFYANRTVDWGLAASLSLVLMMVIVAIALVGRRVVGARAWLG